MSVGLQIHSPPLSPPWAGTVSVRWSLLRPDPVHCTINTDGVTFDFDTRELFPFLRFRWRFPPSHPEPQRTPQRWLQCCSSSSVATARKTCVCVCLHTAASEHGRSRFGSVRFFHQSIHPFSFSLCRLAGVVIIVFGSPRCV